MRYHTSFQIGGPADALAEPVSPEEIIDIISLCKQSGTAYFVMGNGSNLLVSDDGIRGVVIKCGPKFGSVSIEGSTIEAMSGVLLSKLSNMAAHEGLSGLEFASGIPGTLGGAVYMNAGAYGGEMSQVVQATTYLDSDGCIRTIYGSDHRFGYRKSVFSGGDKVILSSVIKLSPGVSREIFQKMSDFNARRREKQPLNLPNCGSVFKRPENHFAGALIQGCGLMGYRIGGAEVSTKHAGFIVNTGGATAEDVRKLIEHIQDEVLKKYGVQLECEVKMVGF